MEFVLVIIVTILICIKLLYDVISDKKVPYDTDCYCDTDILDDIFDDD